MKKNKTGKPSSPRPPRMTSRIMAVKKLKPAAYNPRKDLKPGEPEYEKIKRSIAEFGFVGGMVWNKKTGNLVGGHQRLKVLVKEFGVKEVEVSVVDLPLAKEKALNIALNKITGEWDTASLADLLGELYEGGNYDATMTGFDSKEADAVIAEALADGLKADKADRPSALDVIDQYGVLVTCKNEAQQRKAYKQIDGLGYECKVLTL